MWDVVIIIVVVAGLFFCARPIIKGITKRNRQEKRAISPMNFHAVMKKHKYSVEDLREEHEISGADVVFRATGECELLYSFFKYEDLAVRSYREQLFKLKQSFGRSLPAMKSEQHSFCATTEENFYYISHIQLGVLVVTSTISNKEAALGIIGELEFD